VPPQKKNKIKNKKGAISKEMRWKIPSFLSYEKASKNQEFENVQ
jgi:hypothetical protein